MSEFFAYEVRPDTKEVEKYLTALERKQLPFATSKAINTAAYKTQLSIKGSMSRIFSSPTTYTLRGCQYKKGSKQRPTALVYLKPEVSRYLEPHIKGGARRAKRSEEHLQRKGVLRRGDYTMPANGYRNARGNITKGKVQQIVSGVGGFSEVGFKANITKRSRKRNPRRKTYFAIRTGTKSHLKPGIYELGKRKVKPALVYIRTANYKKKFPFYKLAAKFSKRHFDREFPKALKQALATAKRS